MMHPTSERTPLLYRGGSVPQVTKRSSRDPEGRISPEYQEIKPRKRGLCRRLTFSPSKLMKSASLLLVPTLDDDYMYEDKHNDDSFQCTCGTKEDDGVWLNHSDRVGTIMSSMVWVLFLYSALTIFLLARSRHCPQFIAAVYCTICALALACHIKTSVTDPGSIPSSAVPITTNVPYHTMCSVCQTYKPDGAHHCRICNRCIARMDHHCPWMNTCIGANNTKHFILFLIYTWTASSLALLLFACNYFFCSSTDCEFAVVEMQLVRVMSLLCLGALIFTSSMLISVLYAVITGVGTIDRLKRKANDTWQLATDESTPLTDIFGIAGLWTWWLPMDPIFEDYDRIMGYATLQRLLRQSGDEQRKELEV